MTILATIFEQMCTMDPKVRSRLRPCRHRLVSADSSPLTVKLELECVFPGLCCDMLFVVANIGSDGLLGTEALQSCLPHQLDLRTGQLWAAGRPFDTTVRSTETDSGGGWIFDNFGSTASG